MNATEDHPQEAASPGRVLAAERERHGLSRAEVAHRLHMSVHQIEAIEADDYSRLPTGPFLRGFVRNYAKVLSIDAAPLIAGLKDATPGQPRPGIVVPSQNIRFDPLGDRLSSPYVKAGLLALVAVALAFATMYWWLFVKPTPPGKSVIDSGPPQQLASAPMSAPEPPPPVSAPIFEPPKPETPAQAPSAPASVAPATSAPAPAAPAQSSLPRGHRVIRMRFTGESWVEIKDADGKVLLSRLNLPESEAEVSGRPPFSVVVGNAARVRMQYNGRDFPLEPHTRVSVARLTVE